MPIFDGFDHALENPYIPVLDFMVSLKHLRTSNCYAARPYNFSQAYLFWLTDRHVVFTSPRLSARTRRHSNQCKHSASVTKLLLLVQWVRIHCTVYREYKYGMLLVHHASVISIVFIIFGDIKKRYHTSCVFWLIFCSQLDWLKSHQNMICWYSISWVHLVESSGQSQGPF